MNLEAHFVIKGDRAWREVDADRLARICNEEEAPDMTAAECWARNPFRPVSEHQARVFVHLIGESREEFAKRMAYF